MVDTSLRCLPLLSAPFYNMDTSLSWRTLLSGTNSDLDPFTLRYLPIQGK